MAFHLLSIIRFNFKFIYKKIFLFLAWTIGILLFHTLYYTGYSYHSALDVYLLSIGGVESEQLHLIQMFIVLLPYFGIAIIVDVYMTQMMGRQAIYSILRMKKKVFFIVSHILSLFLIIVLMLLIYHGSLLFITYSIYDSTQLTETLFPWISVTNEDVFSELIFPSFLVQIVGTFCVSCVQLAVSIHLNRFGSGFIFVVIVYLLQLAFPFVLGQHTFISNILKDSSSSILFFIIQFLIIGGSSMYLYLTSKKNIIIFSERS
ncbi:MAG: hypothetical protein QJR05_10910 [Thermoanaerobacterium sp.]|nr:hypothetical protein [Thermoanaerobacterium sp.]